jgi:hypothetical protein
MESYNLFEVQQEGDAGWAHGRLYATGNATASAAFRRGVDLSAGLDVRGEVGGTLGKGIEASLTGGARLTAGLSFRAAYPLDLFSEAGLVARIRAQAAAAAFIRAELSLDSHEFSGLLRNRLSGSWMDLAEIFLTEIEIGAGLWANAMVTVQFLAEAAIVGSFVEAPGVKPGFTCSFQYAAGYGYGAGINFRVNFGLSNPGRLLDRLANQLVAIIEDEIQAVLPQLNDMERTAVQAALPLLRMVLPAVFRVLYEEGKALARPAVDKQASASTSIVQGFIRQAQEALARQLFSLAVDQLNRLLQKSGLGDSLGALSEDDVRRVFSALLEARSATVRLAELDISTANWLPVTLDLLDALSALSTFVIPESDKDAWNDYLALGWAAVVILNQLLGWAQDSKDTQNWFDPETPVAVPSANAITGHIVNRIQKAPGRGITLGDATRFLVLKQFDGVARVDALRAAIPESAPILDFLSSAIQGNQGGSLLQILYQELADLDNVDTADLLLKITAALAPVIEEQLLPKLFTPLEASADPGVVELLHEIVKPTLLSMTRVILPQLESVNNADGAQKMRELISAVLLQSLTRLLLVSTEILADHVATEGPPVMRSLAETARGGMGGPAVDGALAVLSPMAGIPPEWTPTREDLADILDICANTLEYWNANERADWFRMSGDLIRAGLMTGEAALDHLWQSISDSSSQAPVPTLGSALEAFARRLASGLWRLIQFIGPDVWELFKNHFPRMVNDFVVKPLTAAVNEAVNALEQAAQWLDRQIDELKEQIKRLAAEIQQIIDRIAAYLQALAENLLQLIGDAVEHVRALGWNLVYAALFDNPLFKTLRNSWEDFIVNGVRSVYDTSFNSLQWILTSPLQMFREMAVWVQEALRSLSQGGMLEPEAVLMHLRQRALAVSAGPMNLPIYFDVVVDIFGKTVNLGRIDLGTILFPHHAIVGALVDTLMSSAFLRDTVYTVVGEHNQIPAKSNQITLLRSNLENALNSEQVSASRQNLSTGRAVEIAIEELIDSETYSGSAPVRVVLRGANRNFLTSVLGVPARVKMLVNGQEHHYADGSWTEDGDALIFSGKLLASDAGLVPVPVLPPVRYLDVELPANTHLEVALGRHQRPRFVAVPTAPPPEFTPIDVGPGVVLGPQPPWQPPVLSRPGLAELLNELSRQRRTIVMDPLLGVEVEPPANQGLSPVVVQKTELFPTTAVDRLEGVRWTPPGDLILGTVDVWRETILAQRGLNRLDVVVVPGNGQPPVVDSRHFILASGGE